MRLMSLGVVPGDPPECCVVPPPQKQEADDDSEELEIAIDNTAFMDEFFSEVTVRGHTRGWGVRASLLCPPSSSSPIWLVQIEETRQNIDKISENVEEAKKLYSIILSAPIPEQSECGGCVPPVPVSPSWGCLQDVPSSCVVTPQRPKMTWSS